MGDDFDNVNYSHQLSLPPFPRLSHLSIEYCWKLICMPTFPYLDKRLILRKCAGEPLEATLNMATAASRFSIDFTPLSNLKFLRIEAGVLLTELLKNLTSLQHLEVHGVSSQAWQEIEICFKDDLYHFPSLKNIVIYDSPGLEALPDWISNLSSLQHIKLEDCSSLRSLPEEMPHLTNLQTLEIIHPDNRLIEECENEASTTRHKIAHIPKIILQESYPYPLRTPAHFL